MRTTILALAAGLSACASVPWAGAHATGEPLDVVTDQYGNLSHFTPGTRPVPVLHDAAWWYPAQGANQIDEEAFYRIAGEPGAAGRDWTRRVAG